MYELNCEYTFAGGEQAMKRRLPLHALRRWIRELRNDYNAKHIRVSKAKTALDYALEHGLHPQRCCVVAGELEDGTKVTLSLRPGAARWVEYRDYEQDGGVFPGRTYALQAIIEASMRYGSIDKVRNVRVEPVQAPAPTEKAAI